MNLEGLATIDLVRANWREPIDVAAVRASVETLFGWRAHGELDSYKVKVFAGHTIVEEIQHGPSLRITPADEPDTRIWIPLGNRGQRILIDHSSTGRMVLKGPPPGMKLDLGFVAPAN